MIARYSGRCSVCQGQIRPGDTIAIRGFERRVPVHARCTPSFTASAAKPRAPRNGETRTRTAIVPQRGRLTFTADHEPRLEPSVYEHVCEDCESTTTPPEPLWVEVRGGRRYHWHQLCRPDP